MHIENLKKNIKEKLDQRQMKIADLEKKAGVYNNKIRKIVLGYSTNPTLDTLLAISKVFCCTIDELIGKETEKEPFSLPDDQLWDKELMQQVFTEMFKYVCEMDFTPSFKQTIFSVLEIYNYCLSKSNGAFDKQFFDWYADKFLEEQSNAL